MRQSQHLRPRPVIHLLPLISAVLGAEDASSRYERVQRPRVERVNGEHGDVFARQIAEWSGRVESRCRLACRLATSQQEDDDGQRCGTHERKPATANHGVVLTDSTEGESLL